MRFKSYNFAALFPVTPASNPPRLHSKSDTPSSASRGLPGEVSATPTEGVPAQPPTPSLSTQLLEDLLDPTNTPHQICQIHNLTLNQLATITNAPEFQSQIDHLQTINTNRTAAIDASIELQAKSVHQQIVTAALCAADDINELSAAKDPKLASAKSRLLETARKATNALSPAHPPARRQRETNRNPQPVQRQNQQKSTDLAATNAFLKQDHNRCIHHPKAIEYTQYPGVSGHLCTLTPPESSCKEKEKTMNRIPLVAAAASIVTVSAASASIFDETFDGDLSNDRFAPTSLELDLGLNTVSMDVINSNNTAGDLDYFTFNIGAGQSIDSIVLLESSNPAGGFDSAAFVGLALDSVFNFDPINFTGDGLVGFVVTDASVVGNDIITDLSDGLDTLGPGDYSFWVQQTGDDLTRVSLGINVVPTPASGTVLGLLALTAIRRRR